MKMILTPATNADAYVACLLGWRHVLGDPTVDARSTGR